MKNNTVVVGHERVILESTLFGVILKGPQGKLPSLSGSLFEEALKCFCGAGSRFFWQSMWKASRL